MVSVSLTFYFYPLPLMLLYSGHITPRLEYILGFISKELFQEPITFTSDKDLFISETGPKINYSSAAISGNAFWIVPEGLLFETGIHEKQVLCFESQGRPAFLKSAAGDFPFDLLSASFYLLSRYEEYLPHKSDGHGRYDYRESLAYRNDFLHLPLINIWLKDFKTALKEKFPDLYFTYTRFKFIPTYDIDRAYLYVHDGWRKNLARNVRDLLRLHLKTMHKRNEVLDGTIKDPFDIYEWLDALHLYSRLKPHYFFLIAQDPGPLDSNVNPRSPQLKQLIEYYASGYKIGIHPSWQSGDDEKLLKGEIEWLEYIADKKIIHSRQHYIRLQLPETYRKLIKYGIEKDHSMGYGSINGFRASVASSFYWYDLHREEETNLLLFPFCFADTNCYYEQKLTARQAFDELMKYYNAVKAVNGLMITIWHNHLLGTDPRFKGWKEVYEIFLKDEVYWD